MRVSLPSHVLQHCRRTLVRCPEVSDPRYLRIILESQQEIRPFGERLPDLAQFNTAQRADFIIYHLLEKNVHGWALISFLKHLRSFHHEDDLHVALTELITDLDAALLEAEQDLEERVFHSVVQDLGVRSAHEDAGRSEQSVQSAEDWFRQARSDPDAWADRIALAVFHGAPYRSFVAARDLLAGFLRPLAPPPPPPSEDAPASAPPDTFDPFTKSIQEWLTKLGAERTNAPLIPALPDSGQIDIVKLRNPHLAYASLTFVWTDRDHLQPSIVAWLTALVLDRSVATRIRAAVAAGVIASVDFQGAGEKLLLEWAHKDTALYRSAVGRALSVVVMEERHIPQVRTLLGRWANSGELAARWTAARAYVFVGRFCPAEEVIKHWQMTATLGAAQIGQPHAPPEKLLRNPLHTSLLDAIAAYFRSIAALPREQAQPIWEGILNGLGTWDNADRTAAARLAKKKADVERTRRNTAGFGIYLFLSLTHLTWLENGSATASVPVLLDLIEPSEPIDRYRAYLSELFYRALNSDQTSREALGRLHAWVNLADQDRGYEKRIQTLLGDIIARDMAKTQIRTRLALHLETWAKKSNNRDNASRRALEHIR